MNNLTNFTRNGTQFGPPWSGDSPAAIGLYITFGLAGIVMIGLLMLFAFCIVTMTKPRIPKQNAEYSKVSTNSELEESLVN